MEDAAQSFTCRVQPAARGDRPDPSLARRNRRSERITPLLGLHGVGVPSASTLLYVAFPSDYPILDVRALESLGARSRSTYPVSFWLRYLDACRELARVHGVSVRTLDKALWQHSRERSVAPRRRWAGHP